MMKKIKSLFFSMLVLVGCFCCLFVDNLIVSHAENVNQEEKTYCTATLDEDFDETSVIVTMTKEASEINKVYHQSFFQNETIE